MPIICLWPGGQSSLHAALSLATPCLFSASSTSVHLQNAVSALPDSTTPNSCFHTGKQLWVWLTSVPSQHLPGTPGDSRGLPGTDSLPAQASLHSSLEFPQQQIFHGTTSGLWGNSQESSRVGRGIKMRLMRTRGKLRERRDQTLSRDVCEILVFIDWHDITTYNSNALPSHTVQVERKQI